MPPPPPAMEDAGAQADEQAAAQPNGAVAPTAPSDGDPKSLAKAIEADELAAQERDGAKKLDASFADLPLEEKLRTQPPVKLGEKDLQFEGIVGGFMLFGKESVPCADGSGDIITFSAFAKTPNEYNERGKPAEGVIKAMDGVNLKLGKSENKTDFYFAYVEQLGEHTYKAVAYNEYKAEMQEMLLTRMRCAHCVRGARL